MSTARNAESGFTIVELMTSVALTVIITGAMLGLAQRASVDLAGTDANLSAVDGWRTAMADLSRDLRAARTVAASPERVVVTTDAGDVAWTVRDGALLRSSDGEPVRRIGAVAALGVANEGAARRITLTVNRPKDRRTLVFTSLVTPRTKESR